MYESDVLTSKRRVPELRVVQLAVHDNSLEERSFAHDELDHSMNERELRPARETRNRPASRSHRTWPQGHRSGLLVNREHINNKILKSNSLHLLHN